MSRAALGTLLLLAACASSALPENADAPVRAVGPAEGAALQADMAELLIQHHADDAAVPLLRRALAEHPQSARLHTLLGVVLRDKGQEPQAKGELSRALTLDPAYAPAHTALGVLHDRARRTEDALREHRQAVRLAPGSVRAWNNLGFSLYLAGRDREAVDAFREALRVDPSARPVYNNLGFALARLGDEKGALAAFRQAGGEGSARSNLLLAQKLRKGVQPWP
jgi:Flp pilus assembly protein TadD